LTRANRSLETAILRQKQDLDTINQALTILSSAKSIELESLADKWRTASRLAAEELFAGARDKVNKMGGVGAWRERENERGKFAQQWDEQPQKNDDSDEEDVEESEEDEEEGMENEDRPIKLSKKERRQLEKEARAAREEVWGYDDDSAKVKRAKEEEEALMRDDDVGLYFLCHDAITTNMAIGVYYGHDAQDYERRPRAYWLR
jgi:Swi5-dependent recombination DNA repair protein 1